MTRHISRFMAFKSRFWIYRWWGCSRRMRAKGSECLGWRDHRDGNDGYVREDYER